MDGKKKYGITPDETLMLLLSCESTFETHLLFSLHLTLNAVSSLPSVQKQTNHFVTPFLLVSSCVLLQFPHLVYGAVASSAPVKAKLDFSAYSNVNGANGHNARATEEIQIYSSATQPVHLRGF